MSKIELINGSCADQIADVVVNAAKPYCNVSSIIDESFAFVLPKLYYKQNDTAR